MKIWIIIDQSTSLYSWQRMGHGDHEYMIYRDQLHQYSSQTTQAHYCMFMKQGIDYLIAQWVDHILCPPMIEAYYHKLYPQIVPVFQQYCNHILKFSLVGKIWHIGSLTQCEMINMLWWDISQSHVLTPRQVSNRHFNDDLPIRTSSDKHLPHRLSDHKPDHRIINHQIKALLKPLKDAAVDTIIWLDRAYRACDVSITHHSRQLKRHRQDVLHTIWNQLISIPSPSWNYSVQIHYTGRLQDLTTNKKLWWTLWRGKTIEIQQIKIN